MNRFEAPALHHFWWLMVAAALSASHVSQGANVVMPWLCLERCYNASTVVSEVDQTIAHSRDLGAASFEAYDVGDSGELKWNGFTSVGAVLHSTGLETYPMLTSVNITRIRALFANPQPLILAAVHEAVVLDRPSRSYW